MTSLPSGWRVVRLADVAETALGKMLDAARPKGSLRVPYLRNVNVQWGRIDSSNLFEVDLSEAEWQHFQLEAGDLLVCEGGDIGRAAIWRGSHQYVAYQKALHRVRSRGELDLTYLRYLLEHYANSGELRARATGSTILHLPQRQLRKLPIPLPQLSEQQRIVEILEDHLSRLDAAASQTATADRRLESWSRVSLDRLVRGTASGTTALGSLVQRVEAGRSYGGSTPPAGPGQWGIIKVSAMTWGEFRPSENKVVPTASVERRYEIHPGDVLVSRANTTEYVGAPVYVRETPPRLLLSDKSLRIVPTPETDARWLTAVLSARSTRRQVSRLATGTKDSMRNISQKSLLAVTVPCATAEQQEYVIEQWAAIDQGATSLEGSIARADAHNRGLRRTLLTAAFSGRLSGRPVDVEIIEELADV